LNTFCINLPKDAWNLGFCVRSGQVFRWHNKGEHWIGVDGPHWYEVCSSSLTGEQIEYRVHTNATQREFEQLFSLDVDPSRIITAILERGPELAPYIRRYPGLRLMRPSFIVETLFSFLCTQNNHLRRIVKMVEHLSSYGPFLKESDGIPLKEFPNLATLATITEAELRAHGFGYRGRIIPKVAQQILERGGESWLYSLRDASYPVAHQELTSLAGVGPKLADCVLLFGFHKSLAVPIDTHLWQVATQLYFPGYMGKTCTPVRYREVGDFFRGRFGELACWAQQYLFYDHLLERMNKR
jgi:N-glycosylase/DNA lyase